MDVKHPGTPGELKKLAGRNANPYLAYEKLRDREGIARVGNAGIYREINAEVLSSAEGDSPSEGTMGGRAMVAEKVG